jgi:(2R)-3-sulfolactate dehydrogenase (NADP+)
MPEIALDEIQAVTTAALVAHGAAEPIAASVAHAVRTAEANDNRICGLYYLESYCRQLESGRVDGHADPELLIDRPGAIRIDARFGFAQWAFAFGFPYAIASARDTGVCGLSIEHSHTCTSLGYFTEQFAQVGMLAIGATNATARVAPPGGSKRLLGTNPMAMAVPARRGGIAFQFDYSTSAVALGKITMAAAAGEPIPKGWAVDVDGNDTTDAAAALEGSLLSAGGYKGYGLGLLVEVLASALTGSTPSVDVAPLKAPEGPPHDLGQFYLVIDPTAFSGDGFWDRIEALAALVEADGDARLPGTGRTRVDAVDVDDDLWSAAVALSRR